MLKSTNVQKPNQSIIKKLRLKGPSLFETLENELKEMLAEKSAVSNAQEEEVQDNKSEKVTGEVFRLSTPPVLENRDQLKRSLSLNQFLEHLEASVTVRSLFIC